MTRSGSNYLAFKDHTPILLGVGEQVENIHVSVHFLSSKYIQEGHSVAFWMEADVKEMKKCLFKEFIIKTHFVD